MNFDLTDEQRLLQASARDFLQRECPSSLVRAMEPDARGYSVELWRKVAASGWTGVTLPEAFGGSGGALLDLVVLAEELGRALAPLPLLPTLLCAHLVERLGSDSQKSALLSQVAAGDLILSLAVYEPDFAYPSPPAGDERESPPFRAGDSMFPTTRVREADGHLLLEGSKVMVPFAHVADRLLVSTGMNGGLRLLVVDPREPGVDVEPMPTIASDRLCAVHFRQAPLAMEGFLGEPDQAADALGEALRWGATLECALMAGGARQVLQLAVDYAKQRVQFDQPVGSFQAVQHRCADMAIDTDSIRFLTYQAAWALSEGLPGQIEVATAKAWISEAYQRVCANAHQVFGAIGFTMEHDLQLYTRRAKVSEVLFGDPQAQREALACALGL